MSPTPKEEPKMTEKVPLSVLTKFIKPYSGDRESLPAFLTNCDNAICLCTLDQQTVLFKFIISQLEGKAQIAASTKSFENFVELKKFLKATFGEKKHATHLLVELQNCRQSSSESVMQYSLRLESCLTRIQSDIQYSCEDPKELPGRIAAMEDLALNTFILGLNSSFNFIVRCRNPKTLNEAVNHAIEEEKLYNLNKLSKSVKQCTFCNKSGHSASECYARKNYRPSHKTYHVPNPNSNSTYPNPSTSHYNNFNSNSERNIIKSCAYCKNQGHSINECRKRQYNNERRSYQNAQPDTRSPPQRASTSTNVQRNHNNNIHFVENNDIQDDLN